MKDLDLSDFFIGGGSSQSNYKYYNKNEQRIFATTKENLIKVVKSLPYSFGTYKLQ